MEGGGCNADSWADAQSARKSSAEAMGAGNGLAQEAAQAPGRTWRKA